MNSVKVSVADKYSSVRLPCSDAEDRPKRSSGLSLSCMSTISSASYTLCRVPMTALKMTQGWDALSPIRGWLACCQLMPERAAGRAAGRLCYVAGRHSPRARCLLERRTRPLRPCSRRSNRYTFCHVCIMNDGRIVA